MPPIRPNSQSTSRITRIVQSILQTLPLGLEVFQAHRPSRSRFYMGNGYANSARKPGFGSKRLQSCGFSARAARGMSGCAPPRRVRIPSRPCLVSHHRRPASTLSLPNLAALVGRAHHRVAELALEGFGELRHVRERAVDAEATQRVRVGGDPLARVLRSDVLRPDLRPAEEEPLLGREAGDGLRARLAFERLLVGRVGHGQAAEVSDRLADDELAVVEESGLDLEGVELLDDAVGALVELLQVLGRPPHDEVAVGVELRARVVKAVRHLVADDGADAAVVEGVVGLRAVEGRLKAAGGKDY